MTNSKQATARRRRKVYKAFGTILGLYQPGENVFTQGIFLCDDGTKFPAVLQQELEQHLKQQPELLNTQQFFAVWPSASAESSELFLKLKSVRNEDLHQPGLLEAEVDQFSVAGVVLSQDLLKGKFLIQIQRNRKTPEGLEQDPEWQPFNLEIAGQLPDDAVGQFWELGCRRHASELVLLTATAFVQLPRPSKKPLAAATDIPAAAQPNTPAATKAIAPAAETLVDSTEPVASPNAATSSTPGKLEVVVKLNQFPDDVKTVDKGWKEFSVDTGDICVTITVKPKVFATLEQAQQSYPSWVAAISGQMGAATATGFRLESPAIKVFERKAKDSAATEQTQTKHNSEALPATEAQPSPPVTTPTPQQTAEPKPESQPQASPVANPMQRPLERSLDAEAQPSPPVTTPTIQQAAEPKPKSQPQPSPVANPMQRPSSQLKQQRPTKTPSNQGQNQRREQTSPDQKQPTPSAPLTDPKSEPPRFTVTVNGKVIRGRDSVTLNKRLLCVDGVPVGQAKTVVVLGQPKTVQADGGVTQGRNQAVLTSR